MLSAKSLIFFSECVVRTIRVATDRRTWFDVLFSKLNECLAFDIRNHLHLDVLRCSLLIERFSNKHWRLIRAATAFPAFCWCSEERIIQFDQTSQLVVCIAISHGFANLMKQ